MSVTLNCGPMPDLLQQALEALNRRAARDRNSLFQAARRLRALGRWLPMFALLLGSGPPFGLRRNGAGGGQLTVPGARVSGVTATFSLNTRRAPSAHASAQQVVLAEPIGTVRSVKVVCGSVVIHEPTFACRSGRL